MRGTSNELVQMMGVLGSLLLELLDAICGKYALHKYQGVEYEGGLLPFPRGCVPSLSLTLGVSNSRIDRRSL